MRKGRLWTVAAAAAIAIGFVPKNVIASGFKIIYTFQGGDDGAEPVGPLVNIGGVLYGATSTGGAGCYPNGCGTIFSLTTSGTETILHKFKSLSDGIYPYGLVNAENQGGIIGVLYVPNGNTSSLFSITTKGKFTLLGHITDSFLVWPTERHPLTRVGNTWYGVDSGSQWKDCGSSACGYIFAVQP